MDTGEALMQNKGKAKGERQSALRILRESWRHKPRKTFALFSGGNDSSVLAHWSQPWIDAVVHIDTGTSLPGVREHVEAFCLRYEMKLLVYEAGDAYERMVTEPRPNGPPFGFPGPGFHALPYSLLKERQIRRLIRDHKEEDGDRIALLAGARHAESRRRMGSGVEINRDGAALWVNPLLHWTNAQTREYREQFRLPESDAAALCHMSGECTCGAFKRPHEREFLASLYPEWDERIRDLERRAVAAGALNPVWGARPPQAVHDDQLSLAPGPLCADCIPEAA